MPTARELLEQADALMRRNRKRGRGRLGDASTITDALGVEDDSSLAPTVILPDAPAADPIALDEADGSTARGHRHGEGDPMPLDTLGDVPVLTDAVLDWEEVDGRSGIGSGDAFPASAAEAKAVAEHATPPAVLEQDQNETGSVEGAGLAEAPVVVAMPVALEEEFILEIPPLNGPIETALPEATLSQLTDAPIPMVPEPPTPAAPAMAVGTREWEALAEEIRMQVLQRLDLFTDTGLREQLGARLAPIVERASKELVTTINRELGQLVRGYIAEAIEREIESWRSRN